MWHDAWTWHRPRSNPPPGCLWGLWQSASTLTEPFRPDRNVFCWWKICIYISRTLKGTEHAGSQDKESSDSSPSSVSWILDFKILEVGSSVSRYLNFFSLTTDEIHITTLILGKCCECSTQDTRAREHKLDWRLRPGIWSPNWCLCYPVLCATIISPHSTVTLYSVSSFETVSSLLLLFIHTLFTHTRVWQDQTSSPPPG